MKKNFKEIIVKKRKTKIRNKIRKGKLKKSLINKIYEYFKILIVQILFYFIAIYKYKEY